MNPIFLDLGIIQIYWYTVILFLAFLLGGTIALNKSKKEDIDSEFMINFSFI